MLFEFYSSSFFGALMVRPDCVLYGPFFAMCALLMSAAGSGGRPELAVGMTTFGATPAGFSWTGDRIRLLLIG